MDSAQPRRGPRSTSSTSSSSRKTLLASSGGGSRRCMRSQAGSPTPTPPKSMTAVSRPSLSRRFPGAQVTVDPDRRPRPVQASGGLPPRPRSRRPCRPSSEAGDGSARRPSRSTSGTPRRAGGPPARSIRCNASMNMRQIRLRAIAGRRCGRPSGSRLRATDTRTRATDKPSAALPFASGTGYATGRSGARRGSHSYAVLDTVDSPIDARKSHDHVVAEAVQRVVRAGGRNTFDRQLCPLRELRREQPADESRVGVQLVRVHLPGHAAGAGSSSSSGSSPPWRIARA